VDNPLAPFEDLVRLAGSPPSLERAAALTRALKAVPDFQAWLRQERQQEILDLHAIGLSYTEMAPALEVKPERVSGIARGHSRSGGRRAAEHDERPTSVEDRASGAAGI
jgi:hypothetical protein